MKLLSESDRQRIEAAIGEIEKRTDAELVVAVVGRSTHAWPQRVLVALGVALAAGLGFFAALPLVDARFSLVVELGVGVAVFALTGVPVFERLLVAKPTARREVEERAALLFAQHGLYRTHAHTGVLLLVSELERHAVILGDTAIHARLGQAGWQAHIDHVIAAIRRGEAARGILETLERLGTVLAEIAPAGERNDNELSNAVIEEP